MRHIAALAAGLAILLGAALGLAVLGTRSEAAAWGWAWSPGPGAPAVNELVGGKGTRIVNVWAKGRLVHLHIASSREFSAGGGGWVVVRLALPDWGLPGCG